MDDLTPEYMQDMAKHLESRRTTVEWLEKFEKSLKIFERQTFVGEAGAGAATVIMSGSGQLVKLDLNASLLGILSEGDKVIVEEIVKAAYNAAWGKMVEKKRELFGGSTSFL